MIKIREEKNVKMKKKKFKEKYFDWILNSIFVNSEMTTQESCFIIIRKMKLGQKTKTKTPLIE